MRVDFVGNSHLGTIAPALTKARGHRDVAHFISRTYGTVNALVVGETDAVELPYIKLEDPPRYGTKIDLRRSDVSVLVGLNLSLVQMVKLWESFVPVDSSAKYAVPSLSETVWNAYVDAAFDSTFMMRLIGKLVHLNAEAIAVIPQPAPAEWVSSRSGEKFALYADLVASGDWGRVCSDFARQIRRLESQGVRVFPQPDSTLTDIGFTKNEFAMGDPSDTATDSFFSRGDFYHMNQEFARAIAPAFYEWLGETGTPQTSVASTKAASQE